jgi:FtsH-binding integral membrane protein
MFGGALAAFLIGVFFFEYDPGFNSHQGFMRGVWHYIISYMIGNAVLAAVFASVGAAIGLCAGIFIAISGRKS